MGNIPKDIIHRYLCVNIILSECIRVTDVGGRKNPNNYFLGEHAKSLGMRLACPHTP